MANTNFDHPIYKAIAKLIGDKVTTGEDVTLTAFIDVRRGDLYLEASNGSRICVAHDSVKHCAGAWSDMEVTEITSLNATYPLLAQALYENGCDPITAQYLATGELPG